MDMAHKGEWYSSKSILIDPATGKPFDIHLQDTPARMPGFMEIAESDEDFVKSLFQFNPDELLISRGVEEDFYRKMMRDPIISSTVNGKVNEAVCNDPWMIVPNEQAEDDERHQMHVDFINFAFNNMEHPFEDVLFTIPQGGIIEGWSMHEIVLNKPSGRGEFAATVTLRALKPKDVSDYRPISDEFNNLLGFRKKKSLSGGGQDMLPKDKFVHLSHEPKWNDPHGQSELRRAYRAFFLKDNLLKFWSIASERYGMPFLTGTYDPNIVTTDQIAEIKTAFKEWKSRMGFVIPDAFTIMANSTNMQGAWQNFDTFVRRMNEEMVIGIMGGFLGVIDSKDTGARAASEVHERRSKLFVKTIRRAVEHVIVDQLIVRLIDWNFGVQDFYPRMRFIPELKLPEKDIVESAIQLARLMPISQEFLRKVLDIPKPQDDEEIATPPAQSNPFMKQNPNEDELEEHLQEPEQRRQITQFEKGLGINELAKRIAQLERNGNIASNQVIRFWEKLVKKNAEIVLNGTRRGIPSDFELIPRSAIKRYETVVANILTVGFGIGALQASRELTKKGLDSFEPLQDIHLQDEDDLLEFTRDVRQISPTKIVNIIADQTPIEKPAFRRLTDEQRRKAFTVAFQTKSTIEGKIQPTLIQALREGWTIERFIGETTRIFDQFRPPELEIEARRRVPSTAAHAENVFRTNVIGAVNDGRKAVFDSEPEFVPALMYSAVIDDRTTEFCQRWDGFIARRDDPVWTTILPPNHFQCRSIVIAVTAPEFRREQLTSTEDRRKLEGRSGIQPQDGFGTINNVAPKTGAPKEAEEDNET